MAKPPLCKICGHPHWATEEHVLDMKLGKPGTGSAASMAADIVRRAQQWVAEMQRHQPVMPVTRSVPNVTPTVTSEADVTPSVTRSQVTAMKKELEAQAAEIAHLKRELAKARGGVVMPKPMTSAERVAKHRAKQKETDNGTP